MNFGKLTIILHNKFIKREVYIKSLNILTKYYLNMYIIYMEDRIINFIIYKIAQSFFYIKKIGYFYLRNNISITKNEDKKIDLKLKFIFIYLKLIFDYTTNTKYDKDNANINFRKVYKFIFKNLSKLKDNSNLFNNIINIYLKSPYITDENKYMLKYFKILLKKKKII